MVARVCSYEVENGIDDFKTTPRWRRFAAEQSPHNPISSSAQDEHQGERDGAELRDP